MMNPLILNGYEIYQFNKTSTGYTTQVGNDILEIKGGTTPIVPLFNAPPGAIHQTMVVYNDMQNQWSSEYFDKHKAAVSIYLHSLKLNSILCMLPYTCTQTEV